MIGGTTKVPMTPSTSKKMASTKKKVPLGTRKLLPFRLCRLAGCQNTQGRVTHHDELADGCGEDEQRHERQVDEVSRLNQTDGDEERRE